MNNFANNDYLIENGIYDVKDLVNKNIYVIHDRQIIFELKIKEIIFDCESEKWKYTTNIFCSDIHIFDEFGKTAFLDEKEAKEFQDTEEYYDIFCKKCELDDKITKIEKEIKANNKKIDELKQKFFCF